MAAATVVAAAAVAAAAVFHPGAAPEEDVQEAAAGGTVVQFLVAAAEMILAWLRMSRRITQWLMMISTVTMRFKCNNNIHIFSFLCSADFGDG